MLINIQKAIALNPELAARLARARPRMYQQMIRNCNEENIAVDAEKGEFSHTRYGATHTYTATNWAKHVEQHEGPEKAAFYLLCDFTSPLMLSDLFPDIPKGYIFRFGEVRSVSRAYKKC